MILTELNDINLFYICLKKISVKKNREKEVTLSSNLSLEKIYFSYKLASRVRLQKRND